MPPIQLQAFRIERRLGAYTVTLRARGQEPVGFRSDGNLGQVMSGFSVVVDAIRVLHAGGSMRDHETLRGSIELTDLRVEPLTVWPYRWRLVLETAEYRFACNLDTSLESLLAGLSAALKFFGQKYGMVDVFEEVTYNHDRAGEAGLLEGHA